MANINDSPEERLLKTAIHILDHSDSIDFTAAVMPYLSKDLAKKISDPH